MLFHIVESAIWRKAKTDGIYSAASLKSEGFIHLSTASQVCWVAQQFYQGQTGLLLLGIDPDRLQAALRYDTVLGHGTFPHLYGKLNLDAVVRVWDFAPLASGNFDLPPGCDEFCGEF